jgi:hypothetical protein
MLAKSARQAAETVDPMLGRLVERGLLLYRFVVRRMWRVL